MLALARLKLSLSRCGLTSLLQKRACSSILTNSQARLSLVSLTILQPWEWVRWSMMRDSPGFFQILSRWIVQRSQMKTMVDSILDTSSCWLKWPARLTAQILSLSIVQIGGKDKTKQLHWPWLWQVTESSTLFKTLANSTESLWAWTRKSLSKRAYQKAKLHSSGVYLILQWRMIALQSSTTNSLILKEYYR